MGWVINREAMDAILASPAVTALKDVGVSLKTFSAIETRPFWIGVHDGYDDDLKAFRKELIGIPDAKALAAYRRLIHT